MGSRAPTLRAAESVEVVRRAALIEDKLRAAKQRKASVRLHCGPHLPPVMVVREVDLQVGAGREPWRGRSSRSRASSHCTMRQRDSAAGEVMPEVHHQ